MKTKPNYQPEVSSDVAIASAGIVVNDLFPTADPETKTALFLQLAVHLEACIHAYCEATGGTWELVPSRN